MSQISADPRIALPSPAERPIGGSIPRPAQLPSSELVVAGLTRAPTTVGETAAMLPAGLEEALHLPAPERITALTRPDGPAAKLLIQRPDLVERIESLLLQSLDRPLGLGWSLEDLAARIEDIVARTAGSSERQHLQFGPLAAGLLEQLVGPDTLSDPRKLAEKLASRFARWSGGLEAPTARTPETTTIRRDQAPIPDLVGNSPQDETIAPIATDFPKILVGEFAENLKNLLLELRGRLVQLAAGPGQARDLASIQQAAQITDGLLDQITAQQLHSVEGLNRYVHVEVPIDPRTGIDEARLQVFYRQGRGNSSDRDVADRFTVAIFLNLSRLGDVMATVTGVDRSLSVVFAATNKDTAELLESWTDELRRALLESGHDGVTVTVRHSTTRADKEGSTDDDSLWSEFMAMIPNCETTGSRIDRKA